MTDLVDSLNEQLAKVIQDISNNVLQKDFTIKSIASAEVRRDRDSSRGKSNSARSIGSSISNLRRQIPILAEKLEELEAKKIELEILLIEAQENAAEIIEETEKQTIEQKGSLIKVAAAVALLAVLS